MLAAPESSVKIDRKLNPFGWPEQPTDISERKITKVLAGLSIDAAVRRYFQHGNPEKTQEFRDKLSESASKKRGVSQADMLAGLWAKGLDFFPNIDNAPLQIRHPFKLREDGNDPSLVNRQPEAAVDDIMRVGQEVTQNPEASELFIQWFNRVEDQADVAGLLGLSQEQ